MAVYYDTRDLPPALVYDDTDTQVGTPVAASDSLGGKNDTDTQVGTAVAASDSLGGEKDTDTQVGTPVAASDSPGGENPQSDEGKSAFTKYDKVNPALFPPRELFQIHADLKGKDRLEVWFNIATDYLFHHLNCRAEIYREKRQKDLSSLEKEVFGLLGDVRRELERIAGISLYGLGSIKFETFCFIDKNGKLARFQDVFAQDTDGQELSFWSVYHRLTIIDAHLKAIGHPDCVLRIFEKAPAVRVVPEPSPGIVDNAATDLSTRLDGFSAEEKEAIGALANLNRFSAEEMEAAETLVNLSRPQTASPLESSTAAEDSPDTVGQTPSPTSSPSRKRKEPPPSSPAPATTSSEAPVRRSRRIKCQTQKMKESKGAVDDPPAFDMTLQHGVQDLGY
ncbi:hypothetical protein FQN51_003201 [Onygenales sp. PD_10]|nr:hypothetical protein FQN51_003201 [Onygenales sp. PD_10]